MADSGSSRGRVRDERGLSLLEVVIALTIGALSVVAVSSLVTKPLELVEDTARKLDVQTTTDKTDQDLIRNFSRTHLMRRGFVECSDSEIGEIFRESEAFTNRSLEVQPPFTFAYSVYSTLVSVESTIPPVITLPAVEAPVSILPGVPVEAGNPFQGDLRYFSAGSVILLSALNAPEVGKMFQITAIDPDDSTITLDPSGVIFPPLFKSGESNLCDAVSSPGVGSLSALISADENLVFGQSSNVFRADVVRFSTFFKDGSLGGGPDDLWQRTWPVPALGATEIPTEPDSLVRVDLALPDFAGLAFEQASWTPTGGTSNSNGRFEALVRVDQSQRQLASTGSRRNRRPVTATRRRISFDTSTGGQRNFGAVTSPVPADARFPTCGLFLKPVKDFLKRSDNLFAQFYQLSGETADVSSVSGISVELGAPAGTTPLCWTEDQLIPTTTLQEVPVAGGQPNGGSINPTATGALSRLLCDIPNGSSVSGFLSYFDGNLSTMVTVGCAPTGTPTGPPPTFQYDGAASSCTTAGIISFGKLVETGTTIPGPALFAIGCEWSGVGGGFSSCTPDPTKGSLERVKLGPSNLPGGIPGAGGGGNDEITCS